MSLKELNISEKAEKILMYLVKIYPVPGTTFSIKETDIKRMIRDIGLGHRNDFSQKCLELIERVGKPVLAMLGYGRVVNQNEFSFIWNSYLKTEKEFLKTTNNSITPKGWAFIETLKQRNPNSKNVFVAMWSTDEIFDIFNKHIVQAVTKAGFNEPKHIGIKEHNNDINDEIIGEIRGSRFIIADFTGNRGGVYYEAGFAYGLNIPVIYTCRSDWFNQYVKQTIKIKDKENEKTENLNVFAQIHFDVNHRNFIVWETGEELQDKLFNRIKATIV